MVLLFVLSDSFYLNISARVWTAAKKFKESQPHVNVTLKMNYHHFSAVDG